jgi:hypothetical protein
MPAPQRCFLSYSHKDHEGFEQLRAQLAPVAQAFSFAIWHDKRIQAGDYWNHRIQTEIDQAEIFVLLTSADFFNSGYIIAHELPAIRQRHRAAGALVLPVIYRDCYWSAMFGNYIQAVPVTPDGSLRPVQNWRPINDGFAASAKAIAAAIEDWFGVRPTSPWAPTP